jgi:protein-S-isoprenylcysteine O-methyltransferase Ste14
MYKAALSELMVCWLLWVGIFLTRLRFGPKRKAEVTVPNRGMWVQGIGFFLAWFRWPGPKPEAQIVASMVLAPLGVVLTLWAIRHLGKQWRVQAGLYADHELVRTGPYRIVRHPIYASMLAMFLAAALLLSDWRIWPIGLVLMIVGTEMRVRTEDALLASRFGETFAAYKAQVPAYLPFLR